MLKMMGIMGRDKRGWIRSEGIKDVGNDGKG